MKFARDRRDELQFMCVLRQILSLCQPVNQRLIGQLPGFTHAVDQNDALKFLPDLEVLKYRKKWRDARAGG
ncbi:hypothetical protein D3C78_1620490 [compost metagenome]